MSPQGSTWPSEHFTRVELACACGCDVQPDLGFVERLEYAREIYDRPMVITSGMRCAEYQLYINPKIPLSGHMGHGVDVRCNRSADRHRLMVAIWAAGFNRVGLYDGHVHFDCHPKLPPNRLWVGKSK